MGGSPAGQEEEEQGLPAAVITWPNTDGSKVGVRVWPCLI